MSVPASAKDTAKAITRWCENEGVAHTFTHLKGGHLAVVMKRLGKTRRVVFSASPSDRRAVENVLRDVRKEARALGWTPKSQEDKMGICIGGTYSHKPQSQASTGPASPVTITRPENAPPGPPARFAGKSFGPRSANPQLLKAMAKRDAWAISEDEKGRPHGDILKDLVSVGWVLTSAASIGSMVKRAKIKKRQELAETIQQIAPSDTPYIAIDPARQKRLEQKEREIAEEFKDRRHASALALAIEKAIVPVMEAHFAELKAKADKWDAISGLVREA